MNRALLFYSISFGLILIYIGLFGWRTTGSLLFVALLLWGLMKFLGGLVNVLTGKSPFGTYRKIIHVLLLGTVIGFIVFDVPAIYLFKIWTYQISIPNPFSDFVLYAVQALGWGAFLIVFYDSYTLIHLAIDKNFHHFGFSSRNTHVSEKVFSFLGIIGICLFLLAIILALIGFTQSVWPPLVGAFGTWFILENIEFKRTGKTLLFSNCRGHMAPIASILVGSISLGLIFEYFNIISPKQHWVYHGLPFEHIHVLGVPLFLLVSWSWMYIIFLSCYAIVYKKENLWK